MRRVGANVLRLLNSDLNMEEISGSGSGLNMKEKVVEYEMHVFFNVHGFML